MSMNVSLGGGGGFDKTERNCVRMGSAKVLITVIVPSYDNSLWIHELNQDLTCFNVVWKLLITLFGKPRSNSIHKTLNFPE